MSKIIESNGSKRELAGLLQSLSLILHAIPGFGGFALLVDNISGLLGGTGLLHALFARKLLSDRIYSSLASIISVLLLVASGVPALTPYIGLLQKIAALLGAAGFVAKK